MGINWECFDALLLPVPLRSLPRWDGYEAHDQNDDGDWASWAEHDDWTKSEEPDWDKDGHDASDGAAAPVEAAEADQADPGEAEWQEEDMKTEVFLANVWKVDTAHDAMKILMGL